MESHYLLLGPVFLTASACLLIPLLPAPRRSQAVFLVTLLNAVSTSVIAINSLSGQVFDMSFYGGVVLGDISVHVDALSAWFILLANVICVPASWYGIGYMRPYAPQTANVSLHWVSFLIFHLSMIGVCVVQHSLAFLLVWELMTVSSFLLVMFEHQRFQTLNAAMNYLVQMHIGVTFLTVAFIWAAVQEGDYSFEAVRRLFQQPQGTTLFILFFVGFGLKAGFIPLHTWLPHAHPAAPSHVSGVMSGAMVKMGIFGILRTASWLAADWTSIGTALLIVSVATAFYGILNAAIHRDIKRVLAFSTIENIGLTGIGIAIGLIGRGAGNPTLAMAGYSAALIHVLNHGLYKSLLFFTAGNVYQLTHTRNMEQLGGLIKKAPTTAFFFLCGSAAICGLPPLNGFVSKFLLFSALMEGVRSSDFLTNILMISAITGLSLVSGAALFTFGKMFSIVFLGRPRDTNIRPNPEYPGKKHLPLFLIVFLMIAIAVSPSLLLKPLEVVASGFLPGGTQAVPLAAFDSLQNIAALTLLFILLTAAIYLARIKLLPSRSVRYGPTWACGYPADNPRTQYTGKSFSKTLAKLFSFVITEEKKYEEINPLTVFPSSRNYRSSYPEFFEKKIITRATNVLGAFLNYFSFIQHGRVQYYVLYGLIFLLLVMIASIFNLM